LLLDKGEKICRIWPKFKTRGTFIFSSFLLLCVPLLGYRLISLFERDVDLDFLFVLWVGFIILYPFFLLMSFYAQSFVVYEHGIKAFAVAKKTTIFMSWESMKSIECNTRTYEKGYVIMSSDNKKTIWLPEYIKNRQEFVEIVSQYAGKDHFLAKYFQTNQN
jgi:hypothetical protein